MPRQVPRIQPAAPVGGPLLVLAAAALGGTSGVAQAFAPPGAGPVAVGAARVVGGGLLLLGYAWARGELRALRGARTAPGRRAPVLLTVSGVIVAAYQVCFFAAMARTGVAVGTVVTMGSAPVATGLLAWLIGDGRPGPRWYAATVPAVAGCAVLALGGARAGVDAGGVLFALAAGLGHAGHVLVASRMIAATGSVAAVTGVLFGAAAVVLLPVLALSRPVWLATPPGALAGGYLAVVTTAVGYLLYGRGLRTTPAPAAATLTLAEPAVAALLGTVLLGERATASGAAGLALLGASLTLLALPSRGRVRGRRGRPRSRPGR